MSLETGLSLLALALSLLATICAGVYKFAKLEVKVDTMWKFQLRRARLEAKYTGAIKENSPMIVTEKARAAYAGLLPDLKHFYKTAGRQAASDEDLALALERAFGERLVREVCPALGFSEGACLVVAVQLLKESESHEPVPLPVGGAGRDNGDADLAKSA
jgi:hypothetical protein